MGKHKRQLGESSLESFFSPNRYAPLENTEEGGVENSGDVKPPFIFIKSVYNVDLLLKAIRKLEIVKFNYLHISRTKLRFDLENHNDFAKLNQHLKTAGAEYYTIYADKDNFNRVVIKGLPDECDMVAVMEKLTSYGFTPIQMIPIKKCTNNTFRSFFLLDLKPNPKNEKIFKLTKLGDANIKVERIKSQRSLSQCEICQKFGHSKNTCNNEPKCVKCSFPHLSSLCTHNPSLPLTCANCLGQHAADFNECPIRLEMLNSDIQTEKTDSNAEKVIDSQVITFLSLQNKINEYTIQIMDKMLEQFDNVMEMVGKLEQICARNMK